MRALFLSLPAFFLMSGLCFAQSPAVKGSGAGLQACPKSPNCVSSQANDPGHAIAPFVYQDTCKEAFARLKRVINGMKRTVIVEETEEYLHAEARSLIFRFVDDVEFHFPASEKIIHVRSASRVGYSDMGVNRKRVEEIRAEFYKP